MKHLYGHLQDIMVMIDESVKASPDAAKKHAISQGEFSYGASRYAYETGYLQSILKAVTVGLSDALEVLNEFEKS
jgi:hypothetical protein